jgi:choice-of-anchor C domain-containing protein
MGSTAVKKIAFAFAAALVVPASAQAAAFVNGSFESGLPSVGTFTTVNAVNSTAITGWTVQSGSVDYIGTYWNAHSGSRSIDLSGNSAAVLRQTFDTTAGTVYNVKFFLGGNPAGPPPLKALTVTAGADSQNYTFSTTGAPALPGMNWLGKTFTFTALGSSTTLSFNSGTQGFYGPALDSVSVRAVPEPATWAMMIFGFGAIGSVVRRRRDKGLAVA